MTEQAAILLRAVHRLAKGKRIPIPLQSIPPITGFDPAALDPLLTELLIATCIQRTPDTVTLTFAGIEAVGTNFEHH